MDKRVKLGIAATSLAVAGTLAAPSAASADVACIPEFCEPTGNGDVYIKITSQLDAVFIKVGEGKDTFLKFRELYTKITTQLGDVFLKI